MMKCTNCGTEFDGNFCPNCGEPASVGSETPSAGKKRREKKSGKKPLYKRFWFIALVIVLLISCASRLSDSGDTPVVRSTPEAVRQTPAIKESVDEPALTEAPQSGAEELGSDGLRPEFRAAMDAYEKFMDEYIDFMKSFDSNSSDLTILARYAEYMGKYAELCEDFEKWDDEEMNDAELAYYLAVQNRVNLKLLEAAG